MLENDDTAPPADEPGDEGVTPETPPASEQTPADPAETPPKKKNGVAKRIWELTQRIQEERAEKERLLAIIEGRDKPKAEGAPKQEDFGTLEDFIEAKAEWKAQQAVEKALSERDQKSQLAKQQEQQQELVSNWNDQQEVARDKYDDYDEVVGESTAPITDAMRLAIMGSEMAGDVAYFLGKNPQEAKRIATLPVWRQSTEIGKLEARLSSKHTKKPSNAPDPINPVGGKDVVAKDPDKMTIDEWMKQRNEALRKA